MHPTKDEIKHWLKTNGRSREWLGEQCGRVTKRAVDNWLSSPREIPGSALAVIARLMEDDERARQGAEMSHVTLRITTDELNEWSKAFKGSAAETLEDWAIEAIRTAYLEEEDVGAAEGATPPDFDDPAAMARAVEEQHQRRESARRKTRQAKDG